MTFIPLLKPYCVRLDVQALLCLLAGTLAAFAMPPAHIWPALLLALPCLYLCLNAVNKGYKAFLLGYLFWFSYFVFSLYWIGNALLVEDNPYAWAWILAVLGLPALLAFFGALSAYVTYKFSALSTFCGWLGFAAITAGFEFLRGHLFTGFPWNLFGFTWSDTLPILQILRLSDIYLLTLLTTLWATWPALLILGQKKAGLWAGGLSIASFAALYLYGAVILHSYPAANNDEVLVKIVQPNISQAEKWDPQKQPQNFFDQIILSQATGAETAHKAVYILWSETALSYRYTYDETAMAEIRQMLSSYNVPAYLFTGLLRYMPETHSYANSLVMIDAQGQITNIYDKHHLVPFGEYIPFQRYIPLKPVVEFSGFQKGPGLEIFHTPENFSYSPLICYEIIFPHNSVPRGQNADMIFNVTNDAWYGFSAGPHQHLAQARFRAIENATPVYRAANTGISAVFDPQGRLLAKSELFEKDVVTHPMVRKNLAPLDSGIKYAIFIFIVIILSTSGKALKTLRTNFNCAF